MNNYPDDIDTHNKSGNSPFNDDPLEEEKEMLAVFESDYFDLQAKAAKYDVICRLFKTYWNIDEASECLIALKLGEMAGKASNWDALERLPAGTRLVHAADNNGKYWFINSFANSHLATVVQEYWARKEN